MRLPAMTKFRHRMVQLRFAPSLGLAGASLGITKQCTLFKGYDGLANAHDFGKQGYQHPTQSKANPGEMKSSKNFDKRR